MIRYICGNIFDDDAQALVNTVNTDGVMGKGIALQFKERFHNWMSKKKQADFMFVQHMIAVLKNNGRMAVVMPHGARKCASSVR